MIIENIYLSVKIGFGVGKMSIIYVGGVTPVEVAENRDKIVDALNSCQTSLETGILPGGGTSYIHGLKILEKLKFDNHNMNVGVNIFYQALFNTLKLLFKNSPLFADILIDQIKNKDNPLFESLTVEKI